MSELRSMNLLRLTRNKPVDIVLTKPDLYPAQTPSLIGSLHDTGYYQGLLSNENNFSEDSQLDVSQVVNGNIIEQELVDEVQCRAYLDVSYQTRL